MGGLVKQSPTPEDIAAGKSYLSQSHATNNGLPPVLDNRSQSALSHTITASANNTSGNGQSSAKPQIGAIAAMLSGLVPSDNKTQQFEPTLVKNIILQQQQLIQILNDKISGG